MLATHIRQTLAQELEDSEPSRVQLEHFSKRHPGMTVDDSDAIQRAWMDLKRAHGRVAVGHKIGLTSRAMQQASQITEPDFGLLLDDMVLRDGSEIETARDVVPRLEVESAFILAKPPKGPGVSLFDVLNATDYVVPALELIDARIEQFDRVIADTARHITLVPGDVILVGTPCHSRSVDAGQYVECEITGLVRLGGTVTAIAVPRASALGVGHDPADTPDVRRVALGFDERVPEHLKDNLRQAKAQA